MNIVYAAPFGLGQKTTVWARTLPLAQQMVARGHRAAIIIPPWDTPDDAGTQRTEGGVDLVNVTLGGGPALVTRRMLREIHARRPDIVHVVKPRAHAGLVQWWLWQQRRPGRSTPTLILDVDDWEQAWNAVNDYGPAMSRFLTWQEEWGIRHADGITAASRWLEARARSYAPATPVHYLPNGVTLPPAADDVLVAEAMHARAAQPSVLYYSRFVEVDPQWLARCWQTVLAHMPQAQLLVAGTPLQPGLEKPFQAALADRLGAQATSVEWLGFVTPATQADLYTRVRCAIFPAREEPLQQAKCSVRLATTLLNGVPVVASAVGEQQGYGADGAAALVPADASPEEFGTAVVTLLADAAEQVAMPVRAAAHLAARYTWERLGDTLDAFYHTVHTQK